ncbi:hypothetical protein FHG68_14040 [Leptospira weilii]|nr:hypothetical protein FHG67_08195 [Leptospira weilii]QDK27674.1 hypothetical protein FHG68_14040 [Leptospira weilii]
MSSDFFISIHSFSGHSQSFPWIFSRYISKTLFSKDRLLLFKVILQVDRNVLSFRKVLFFTRLLG